MPKVPKFEVKKTARGWKLNIPASISDTGKKQELYYTSRDNAAEEAKKRRGEYRANGQQATVLPPRVADDALRAWLLLEPLGVSLTEAARKVVREHDQLARSVKVSFALDSWEKAKEPRWRGRTKASYKSTAKKLRESFADRILASLKPEEITKAIHSDSLSTFDLRRSHASAFWRWCAKSPRKWCRAEVFNDVETVEALNGGDISVSTPAEVRALFEAAEKYFPETVCMYSVGYFGGARVEERKRLDVAAFNEEGIEMGADITKKRRRRHIPMNDTLEVWLKAYPFKPCPNWKRKDQAVRRLAGWDVKSDLLTPERLVQLGIKELPPITRGRWPQNAIRHTHASVEIANGATLEDLLFRFGHTEKPDALRSHYVGRISKKAALAILAIGPNGETLPLLKSA